MQKLKRHGTWLVVMLLGAAAGLAACGGGGGDSGDGGNAGGGQSTEFAGQVWVMGAAGAPIAAPAGIAVQLRPVGADGSLGTASASATTAADGRYALQSATAVPPGSAWALEATTDGGTLRAWVAAAAVDVSPASEAVYQELADVVRARGALPAATPARLARLINAATQFLTLTDVHLTEFAPAVAELRSWLALDPATAAALGELRSSGQLPASLGDVGGLFGVGNAAWTSSDTTGGFNQHVMRYRAVNGGEFDYWSSSPGDAWEWDVGPPDVVYRMVADGLRQQSLVDSRALPLDQQIGPVRVLSYGLALGDMERLASAQGKTTGLTFDADQVEDDFVFTSDQRLVGYESITHGGRTLRALRITRSDTIVVTLSLGGTVRLEQTNTSWHVPFGGALRTTVLVTAVEASGASTSASATITVERAAINGTSWPGGVHAKHDLIDLGPYVPSDPVLVPFIAPDARHVLFTTRPHATSDSVFGFRVLDLQTRSVTTTMTLPGGGGGIPLLRAAPDGQSFFLLASGIYLNGSPYSGQDLPLDQAQAMGALIVRHDARTLASLRSVQLPAVPSALLPGRGFARNRVEDIIVSPLDGQSFAIASHGLLRYGAGSDGPAILTAPDAEYSTGATAGLHGSQAVLHGWDEVRDDLYFRYRPFWSFTVPGEGDYRASATDAGLTVAAMSVAPSLPWHRRQTVSDADGITFASARGNGGDGVLTRHARDGAVLASFTHSNGHCGLHGGRPVCLDINGSVITLHDVRTLAPTQSVDLAWDMRWRASQETAPSLSITGAPAPGLLIASTPSRVEGSVKVSVLQLRLPR